MNSTPGRAGLILAVVALSSGAYSSALGCVVGTDTAASCTEAALDVCLPDGAGFNGTIKFMCGGPATITVTNTKTISADTTIDGASLITISGGNSVAVFAVNEGIRFTVHNLTIANAYISVPYAFGGAITSEGILTVSNSSFVGNYSGWGGGAIDSYFGGMLTVTDSNFSDNSASFGGAIAALGGTVTNCTFSGNSADNGDGGGINNYGTLTITNSTFSNNSAAPWTAGEGGALSNSGTVLVSNSTFSHNDAAANGGGIANYAKLTVANSTFTGNTTSYSGGGISNGGALAVINSTFADNRTTYAPGGGGISNGGDLTLTNCTFSSNDAGYGSGSGINSRGTLTVANTIVAKSSSGRNCVTIGTFTDAGHNLDDGATCRFAEAQGSLSDTDPKLDPAGLASNGGPTQTIALQPDSPAINAGDEGVCAAPPVNHLDQRGFVRLGHGATHCSIGAYEYGAPPRCVGDCNDNDQVTVDELLRGISIALGIAALADCLGFDINGDGVLTVDEITMAVQSALASCATARATITPTPTVTATPSPSPTPILCPDGPPRVYAIEASTIEPQQVVEGCVHAGVGPIRVFSEVDAINAAIGTEACGTGEVRFSATLSLRENEVSHITVCQTRSSSCGLRPPSLCTRTSDTGSSLDVVYRAATPITPMCGTACTPTPTPTSTFTPSCAPTGTPFCAEKCYPCPTVRPFCYASACGACIENPHCGPSEVRHCGSGREYSPPFGCCGCATPTTTATASATPTIDVATATTSATATRTSTVTPTRTPAAGEFVYARGFDVLSYVREGDSLATITRQAIPGGVGMAASPDGSRLFVAASRSLAHLEGLAVVETSNPTIVHYIDGASDDLYGVAVNDDGTLVYGTAPKDDRVLVIDPVAETLVDTIPLPIDSSPQTILVHGSRAYVTLRDGRSLGVIDLATAAVLDYVPVDGFPTDVALDGTAGLAYVVTNTVLTGYGPGTVSIVDTNRNAVIASVTTDRAGNGIALTPDGKRAYITYFAPDYRPQEVSVYETSSWSLSAAIPVGYGYGSVAITTQGRWVYVTSGRTLSKIDTSTNQIVDSIETFQPFSSLLIVDVPPTNSSTRHSERLRANG